MLVVAEKINGTLPLIAKAVEARDAAFIQDLAQRQAAAGADFIDLNIVASQALRDILTRQHGEKESRIQVIVHGVDVRGAFNPALIADSTAVLPPQKAEAFIDRFQKAINSRISGIDGEGALQLLYGIRGNLLAEEAAVNRSAP